MPFKKTTNQLWKLRKIRSRLNSRRVYFKWLCAGFQVLLCAAPISWPGSCRGVKLCKQINQRVMSEWMKHCADYRKHLNLPSCLRSESTLKLMKRWDWNFYNILGFVVLGFSAPTRTFTFPLLWHFLHEYWTLHNKRRGQKCVHAGASSLIYRGLIFE